MYCQLVIQTFDFRFTYAIEIVLPLLLVLAWILPVAMLCKNIVYEKEKRLKEVMRMMGLGNGVHWLAWFINAFVVMMFTMGLLVVLLTVRNKSYTSSFLQTYCTIALISRNICLLILTHVFFSMVKSSSTQTPQFCCSSSVPLLWLPSCSAFSSVCFSIRPI